MPVEALQAGTELSLACSSPQLATILKGLSVSSQDDVPGTLVSESRDTDLAGEENRYSTRQRQR
ncbi:hypothetical protein PG996_012760 [Apiospora saccharicola]|uniref:Uncharacterized protein n=1 Tax=Apiospora saccharicola TaxID=335842 RepID=A0ABR1U3I0_9PEZI